MKKRRRKTIRCAQCGERFNPRRWEDCPHCGHPPEQKPDADSDDEDTASYREYLRDHIDDE